MSYSDDVERLKELLNDLELQNEFLRFDLDKYTAALEEKIEDAVHWQHKFEQTDSELEELRNYLDDLRKRWKSERCEAWGHFEQDGICTDCGEEICR